jgi:hypothetical protein
MAEVLTEFPEEVRPHALETADYWISVGLTIGLERPHQARGLLEVIEAQEAAGAALAEDAAAFLGRRSNEAPGLVSSLYRTARLANNVSSLTSGNPHRMARRAKNRIVGRALARGGFWRLLWGR